MSESASSHGAEASASGSSGSGTASSIVDTSVTETVEVNHETAQTLRLRLIEKPSNKITRRVSWTNDTIDNEMLNKKKSKCCCVFKKVHNFGESSSEDENEDHDCAHCKGHRKRDYNSKLAQKSADEVTTEEKENMEVDSASTDMENIELSQKDADDKPGEELTN